MWRTLAGKLRWTNDLHGSVPMMDPIPELVQSTMALPLRQRVSGVRFKSSPAGGRNAVG